MYLGLLLPALLNLFLLSSCHVQPQYEGFYHVVSRVVMFDSLDSLLEASSFLKGNRRRNTSGGEGMLGVLGGLDRRGNCGWAVLYERRIYFLNKYI